MVLRSSYLMDFRLPVPACCRACGKRNWEVGWSRLGFGSDAISVGTTLKKAGGDHGGQTLVEGSVADAAQRPQFGDRQRLRRVDQCGGDALIDRRGCRCLTCRGCEDLKSERIMVRHEFQVDGGRGRGRAMLDGERELGTVAAQIQVRVAPGMELGRTAQRLACAQTAAALFGMMHEQDSETVTALQFSKIGEERRDLAAGVLVDPVQTNEGIEHQQPGSEIGDRFLKASAVGRQIEPQRRRGDDVNIEVTKADAGGGADALQAAAHDVQGVLGGVEQDTSGLRHGEPSQARGSGGDRDGKIQREEGFAALRFPTDDTDGIGRPQIGDQPALLLGTGRKRKGRCDGERVQRRRPAAIFAWAGEGVA